MATILSHCPQCGFIHDTVADRLACDARNGKRWPTIEVRNPVVMCNLCGCTGELDLILDHFQYVESRRDVHTGRLIRSVVDAGAL